MPRGGPDGGDGGRGGDVVLVCDPSRRDLAALRIARHFKAGRGRHGEGARRHGARGETLEVPVPPGTSAEGVDGTSFDLVEPGQRAIVAAGGWRWARQQALRHLDAPGAALLPRRGCRARRGGSSCGFACSPTRGWSGLPNAGKSSLLARLTNARPKVADYPFTTVDPILGTIDDRRAPARPRRHPRVDRGRGVRARAWAMSSSRTSSAAGCSCTWSRSIRPRGRRSPPRRTRRCAPSSAPTERGLAELARNRVLLEDRPAARGRRGGVGERSSLSRSASSSDRVLAGSSATGEGIDELSRALFAAVPRRGARRAGAWPARWRVRGRAHDLPPGGGPGLRRRARERGVPGRRARGSRCSSPATTCRTSRRSPTSRIGCARSA